MYSNFIEDRKILGYEVLKDNSCGINLVSIVYSTVPRLVNPSKYKRQFVFKLKCKSKRLIVIITLVSTFLFNKFEPATAIGLSLAPTPIVKIQPSEKYKYKVEIAKLITRKKDLIVYRSPKEILFLMYLNDPRILSNPEVLKLVNKLRGGS